MLLHLPNAGVDLGVVVARLARRLLPAAPHARRLRPPPRHALGDGVLAAEPDVLWPREDGLDQLSVGEAARAAQRAEQPGEALDLIPVELQSEHTRPVRVPDAFQEVARGPGARPVRELVSVEAFPRPPDELRPVEQGRQHVGARTRRGADEERALDPCFLDPPARALRVVAPNEREQQPRHRRHAVIVVLPC